MSRKSSNVTLKDIAAQAGVSHTAVSAALHGTGRISDEKREHILSVAKKMSYRPRLAAQMLRSNRTGHLGMIVCGVNLTDLMDSGFHGPIVSSFIQACEERDIRYHIEFAKEAVNPDDDFIPPAYFSGGMVDGALVVGYCDQPFAHWLEHENTRPWVSVGESAAYFVKDNSEQNVYQVAQHLVALGCERRFEPGHIVRTETMNFTPPPRTMKSIRPTNPPDPRRVVVAIGDKTHSVRAHCDRANRILVSLNFEQVPTASSVPQSKSSIRPT